MPQEDNILEMETLCTWNGNFRLGTEKVGYSEGRPFVPENFLLIRAKHLHIKFRS